MDKITIIGAGAIGGVLGAYLVKAGHQVDFFDINQEHVRAMNENGLTIEGPEETFTVSVNAYTPNDLINQTESFDTVLLCVKAHHTIEALTPFIPYFNNDSAVVSLQNGLCEYEISRLVGKERTIGCFVNFSADYLSPGKILYGGVASLYLGEIDNTISDRVKHLTELLQCWGPAKATENIWGYLWGKMSYAGLLYGTALVDESMATVVRKVDLRDMLMELCSEILETAHCLGIHPLGFDDWEPALVYPREIRNRDNLDNQLEKLAVRMASNKKTKSGIWRDLAVRRRKTEVDAQLVPIANIAKENGIQTPLLNELINKVKGLEEGSINMSWNHLYDLNRSYINN